VKKKIPSLRQESNPSTPIVQFIAQSLCASLKWNLQHMNQFAWHSEQVISW